MKTIINWLKILTHKRSTIVLERLSADLLGLRHDERLKLHVEQKCYQG